TTINLSHLVDESYHPLIVIEHEGIDGNSLTSTTLGLKQGLLFSIRTRKGKLPPAKTFLIPNGRATVGNHNDLLVNATMPGQELARQHQAVRHIGPFLV